MTARVRTCLWFGGHAEEAVDFYVSLIPDSRVENVFHPSPDGPALRVDFTLGGAPYQALNSGPQVTFTEAASITVLCKDQDETDRLWNALIADGGSEGRCGWLKDRFGLSWQIVPEALPRLLSDPDQGAAQRARQAMRGMSKINIAELEAAHRGQ